MKMKRNKEPEMELSDVQARIAELTATLTPQDALPLWNESREDNRRRVAADVEFETRMKRLGIGSGERLPELRKLSDRLEADRPVEAQIAELDVLRRKLEIREALEGRADGIPTASFEIRTPRVDYFLAHRGPFFDGNDPSALPGGIGEPFARVAAVYGQAVARVIGAAEKVSAATADATGCEGVIAQKQLDAIQTARLALVNAGKEVYGDLRRGLRDFVLADPAAIATELNNKLVAEANAAAAGIAAKVIAEGVDEHEAREVAENSEAVRRIAAMVIDDQAVKVAVAAAEGRMLQLAAELRALIETELAALIG